ncbi:MAG: methyltransferase family protein [Candidatus Odinarchaeota archaeon]
MTFSRNAKKFQKAFPYICSVCGEFTYRKLEYCENCSAQNSIREAIKEDYIKHSLKKQKEYEERKKIADYDEAKNLVLLAIIFTIVLIFITIEIPILINAFLRQIFPDIHPIYYPDEIKAFINTVRPIGYILLIVIVLLIILGFLIKNKKLTVSSSFLLFLPTFGIFASTMFFLAGIGVLEVVWLPLDTPLFNFLTLGCIVFIPVYLFYLLIFVASISFIGTFIMVIIMIIPWVIMIIGVYIFIVGVISWFYGKQQKKDIIDFSIYKHSRHPQYLGFLIWSYGNYFLYIANEFYYPYSGLKASLPWVIFALIIISVAILEEIKLSKKYPEKYREYRKKVPFLIKLPKTLNSTAKFPLRLILKKDFPETRKDVLKVVIFYGSIISIFSLLLNLIFPPFFL